jgi:hypothetical protein
MYTIHKNAHNCTKKERKNHEMNVQRLVLSKIEIDCKICSPTKVKDR